MVGKLNALITLFCLSTLAASAAYKAYITNTVPAPLYYNEFVQLQESTISNKLQEKLDHSLDTIVVAGTNYLPYISLKKSSEYERKFFRVSHWNMERGLGLDFIRQAFKDPDAFFNQSCFPEINEEKNSQDKALIEQEIQMLKETDIFTLNEVDVGVQRTGYKNIALEFGKLVNAAFYTFVPEFIEIDDALLKDPTLDKSKYQGLHGNAILSKYPIKNVRSVRLPVCYDWFEKEKENLVLFEKTRRKASESIVQEEIITELRRGNRVALIADIDVPQSNQDVTVVSLHLENRCSPKCREKQLQTVLDELKDVTNPTIIGGDFNNFEKSAEPTTLIKIVRRTLSDPQNLARITITYFNPYSLMINPGLFVLNAVRKYKDPTTFGVPIVLRNKAKKLFDMIYDFKFTDSNRFDFSGGHELSYDERGGKLSNSNQRALKGFVQTYWFQRSFGVAEFKVDWLFFKPLRIAGCDDDEDDFDELKAQCKRFIPAFGHTLRDFNNVTQERQISDHAPISAVVFI